MDYLIVKWIHILSSTVLFGTGLGSAYYMFFASRTRDARVIAVVVRNVVRQTGCSRPPRLSSSLLVVCTWSTWHIFR
jgi:hypothetical protein